MNPRVIAREYLEFTRQRGQPALGSPWEAVQDAVHHDPVMAWRLLMWTIALARDDFELSLIGAGPLEHFLIMHEAYVDKALRAARRHGRFRRALHSADIRGASPEAVARLDTFFATGP